jgi:tRNA threonylcarbamoyladenosine biosynthesis protein TsaB
LKILAIESSAKAASVAVCEDGELLGQYFQNSGLTHSVTLMCMARDLLANIGLAARCVDVFAVAAGPGSFTGVRIGVSTAKGLAWGAGKPLCAVSTLEAMAWEASDGAVACPVMDARRGQVYNALFAREGGAPARLCDDRAISASGLADDVSARLRGAHVLLFGDAAGACLPIFSESGIAAGLAGDAVRLPCAHGVALAATRAAPRAPGEVLPNYIRAPQAEQKLTGGGR